MDKKNLSLDFDLRFQEIKELNPSFDMAKIAVAYHGQNRNQSSISKEVFENAVPSLFNIPVVGRYIPEEDDFGGHDIVVVEKDGEQSIEAATVPFGVVPESATVSWEMIADDDGKEREYLVTDCVIWKRSYGYSKLVSQKTWSQSMEITVNDYDFTEDGVMEIKDMTFCALCILGSGVEPCFESANIQFNATPDNEDFRKSFSLMLSELKELAAQAEVSSESEIGKGGNGLDEEKIVYDGTETPDETPEETSTEPESDPVDTDGAGSEGSGSDSESGSDSGSGSDGGEAAAEEPVVDNSDDDEQPGKKRANNSLEQEYSKTYNELRELLCSAVDRMSAETAEGTYQAFYLTDFDDEYVYMEVVEYSETGYERWYARSRYSRDEEGVSLANTERVFVEWLTQSEVDELEASRKELNALRDFKADRLEEIHREEVDAYVGANFSDIQNTEEYIALGDAIYALETDELAEKLFAIRGKHAVFSINTAKNTQSEKETIKIPVKQEKAKSSSNRYGNLFDTYAKK